MSRPMLARAEVTVILPVKELERARDFYVNRLGLEAEGLAPDGKFILRANGARLALMPKPGGTKAEHTALSFKVDDIAAEIQALKARGVSFHDYDLPGFKTVTTSPCSEKKGSLVQRPRGQHPLPARGHCLIYHREPVLQDRFDSRRLADRLVEKLWRTAFTAEDKAFIEASHMFFLATADASGQPDCSYKGGLPGFVRVTGRARFELRRQRHVPQPRQRAAQPARRCSSSTSSNRGGCGSTARKPGGRRFRVRGRPARRPDRGRRDLPQLPALYPPLSPARDLGVCAEAGV